MLDPSFKFFFFPRMDDRERQAIDHRVARYVRGRPRITQPPLGDFFLLGLREKKN